MADPMIRLDFQGYGLCQIETEDDDYKCNWCNAMIPLGGISFHQEKTNFDMCATCAGHGLRYEESVAGKKEAARKAEAEKKKAEAAAKAAAEREARRKALEARPEYVKKAEAVEKEPSLRAT